MDKFTISFTLQELQYLVSILEVRPYNEVLLLLKSINDQYEMAVKDATKPPSS